MTKRSGANYDNGFIFKKNKWRLKEKREKNPVSGFGNNPIHPLLSMDGARDTMNNSCGHVIRDFQREAKTRCNF